MKISDALLVALVTVIINFLIQIFFKNWDKKSQRLSVQLAIIAEVKALKNIIDQRKYLQDIDSIISYLENNRGHRKPMSLEIQSNVFPVYSSNLDKIGQLSPSLAPKIVTFYSLLSSILQDVKMGGLLSIRESATFENYKNVYELLNSALEIADEIIHMESKFI